MRFDAPITRRDLLADAGKLVVAGALAESGVLALPDHPAAAQAAGAAVPSGYRDADYWAFADRIAAAMHRRWDPHQHYYHAPDALKVSAAMLVVHGIAAIHGHDGPSRADDRARALAERLCQSPPWADRPWTVHSDNMFHHHGWVLSMTDRNAPMDKALDPKVAEGLSAAWRARKIIGLTPSLAKRMAGLVNSCAHDEFWAYPNTRLNQINWNAEMFAHASTMTGDPALLVGQYRRHVEHFVHGMRRPWRPQHGLHPFTYHSPNLGPGYRFNRQNTAYPSNPHNLDSAEYANITAHFLLWHRRARQVGMRPLPAADMRRLTAWVERLLYGYWTHSGFMNWDTGMGLGRWMKGKFFAWGHQGLQAIMFATEFQSRPEMAAWAKYIFDRSLDLYRQWAADEGGGTYAPASLHGIHRSQGGEVMFAARMAANAARAIDLGLGERPARQPPPFYAYDPDIGRLAVSTPSYSTAVLVANRGAVPYGGQELARLYDADGRPVATIGGRPPAAFGVVVRDAAGRQFLSSQTSRKHASMSPPPLRLTRAPRGAGHVVAYPIHAYAGPFEHLNATCTVREGDVRIRTDHRFRGDHIETTWTVRSAGRRTYAVDVLFPVWTRGGRLDAILHGGRRIRLVPGAGRVDLGEVSWFHLRTDRSGYVVVVSERSPGPVHARGLHTQPQPYAPRAGPTLALGLAGPSKFHRRHLTARIAPARTVAEAQAVARHLGGQ